jgi:hypothetical protein
MKYKKMIKALYLVYNKFLEPDLAKSSNDDHRLDCIKKKSLKDYWISNRSEFFLLAKIRQK